jgi:hypothetical protein
VTYLKFPCSKITSCPVTVGVIAGPLELVTISLAYIRRNNQTRGQICISWNVISYSVTTPVLKNICIKYNAAVWKHWLINTLKVVPPLFGRSWLCDTSLNSGANESDEEEQEKETHNLESLKPKKARVFEEQCQAP